ncbi:MAG: radical SAM protein [Candidatus Helarchaeota archaeon]
MKELIIDITYKCNSSCNYCQWSSTNSIRNRVVPIKNLLISKEYLENLNITRIVINGGEPIISPNLQNVLTYYNKFNFAIRLISNGIKLNEKNLYHLISQGVKEFVISLDSLSYEIYAKNRNISQKIFKKILNNLNILVKVAENLDLFLGLNVVLTSKNCYLENILELIDYAKNNNFNQIKFQPVFDDGYLSRNMPELILNKENIPQLTEIKKYFYNVKFPKKFSNPIGFWSDLIALLSGIKLNPLNCKVMDNAILLHEGILKFCYWCNYINYGSISNVLSKNEIINIEHNFIKGLCNCIVQPQCFCLQPIDHKWI